jgi:hypothetical protein
MRFVLHRLFSDSAGLYFHYYYYYYFLFADILPNGMLERFIFKPLFYTQFPNEGFYIAYVGDLKPNVQ